MKRLTRGFVALAGAATMLLTLTVGTAGADPVTPPTKVVSAGMRIKLQQYSCTLGAVGTDSSGRKVGITAGHCNPLPTDPAKDEVDDDPVHAPKRKPVTSNKYPVEDWRDTSFGPIGWIRYVSADYTDGNTTNEALAYFINNIDYMVIEFADNVQLSSQVMTVPKYELPFNPQTATQPTAVVTPSIPWGKVTSVYSDSSGNPTVPVPGLLGSLGNPKMCHAGAITTQEYAQADQPKVSRCGGIYRTQGDVMYTNSGTQQGDSGGPVWVLGQFDKWAGIVSWYLDYEIIPGVTFRREHAFTSAKKILDDLNRPGDDRPANFPGKGFQITNN